MKKYKTILPLFLLPFLWGCGIYKNYERPSSLPVDSLYRDSPQSVGDSSLGYMSWRTLFTDTCLVHWIETGLRNNTNLLTANLKVEEAQATLYASKRAFLPSLSLTPQGELSSFDGSKPTKTYSLGASADWELDLFGSLRNAKKSAQAALAQSQAYRQAVQSSLVATIAQSYYYLLMLDRQLAITRETTEQWACNIQAMEALKRAGQENEAAVSRSRASYLSAKSSLLSLQQQVHEQENALAVLVGMTPQKVQRGTIENQTFTTQLSAGLPLSLLDNRPDVREAESSLARAFYTTCEARSAFYPSVTLSGTAGWTNNSGAAIVNPGKMLLNAIGSLTQPLLNKGKNRANLKIAKARQEEALLSFKQSLLDAGEQVNNALVQYETAKERIEVEKQQVQQLQITVKATQLNMQYSSTTALEVITARQSLLSAQLSQVSQLYNEIEGIISLYHALGGGTR